MKLSQAVPELVGDIEGALVRIGRGDVVEQLRAATLASWTFDEFAQSTYLRLAAADGTSGVEDTLSLHDDVGVNLDLDGRGRLLGIEVFGYEDILARLDKSLAV